MKTNLIPIRNKELVWRDLNGEAVLLNPNDGKYFGMNEVGSSFWEKVDGQRTLGVIIDMLLEEYNVERTTLENDIIDLTAALKSNKIISLEN